MLAKTESWPVGAEIMWLVRLICENSTWVLDKMEFLWVVDLNREALLLFVERSMNQRISFCILIIFYVFYVLLLLLKFCFKIVFIPKILFLKNTGVLSGQQRVRIFGLERITCAVGALLGKVRTHFRVRDGVFHRGQCSRALGFMLRVLCARRVEKSTPDSSICFFCMEYTKCWFINRV